MKVRESSIGETIRRPITNGFSEFGSLVFLKVQ